MRKKIRNELKARLHHSGGKNSLNIAMKTSHSNNFCPKNLGLDQLIHEAGL